MARRERRRIVVDGIDYGYTQTRMGEVSAWREGDKRGATLRARFGLVGYGGFGILPNQVATLIRYALAHGWTPDVNGPPWLLEPSAEANQLFDATGPICSISGAS